MSSPSITRMSLGYSATVRMRLLVGAQSYAVAKVGPDFIVVKESVHLELCRAQLVVEIDGVEDRSSMLLPDGVRGPDERTRIEFA